MKIILGAWTEQAACKGKTDLFFPEQGDSKSFREAVSICMKCPVIEPCKQHILENDERFGIWAGTNAVRRRILRRPDSTAQWTQCGTYKRYQHGCRCQECRDAFIVWERRILAKRRMNATVTPSSDTAGVIESTNTGEETNVEQ